MEDYFIVILLILVVFLSLKNTSKYSLGETSTNWQVQFINPGYEPSTPLTLISSTDQFLSRNAINLAMWNGTCGVPAGTNQTAIKGFRKTLQIGGGGAVDYFTTDPTSLLTVNGTIADTYLDGSGNLWNIPSHLFMLKTPSNPILSCPNGTVSPDGTNCLCNAGYYMNGTTCTLCGVGQTSPAGATTCSACTTPGVGTTLYWTTSGSCATASVAACTAGQTISGNTPTSAGTCGACTSPGVGSSLYWTTPGACTTAPVTTCPNPGTFLSGNSPTNAGTCGTCTTAGVGTSLYWNTPGSCGTAPVAPCTGGQTLSGNTPTSAGTCITPSPCTGSMIRTSTAACPSCIFPAGNTPVPAVYTWSTSSPLVGTGTCPTGSTSSGNYVCTPPTCAAVPCVGSYGRTTIGTCPTPPCNQPAANRTDTYTWTTTTSAANNGTACPPATSTASVSGVCSTPSACPANCVGGYTNRTTTGSCPIACGYVASTRTDTYTWATTTAAVGTGTCPTGTTSLSYVPNGCTATAGCQGTFGWYVPS